MNSYNDYTNVKRIQVTNHSSDEFVSLIEYIIFENGTNDKYAIFKFQNNLEQYLYEVKFIVTQFDKEGRTIEKSTISYDGFRVDGREVLVPDAKFKCNKDCDSMSTELIYGAFEKIIFDNGNIINVKYDYQDYKEDFEKSIEEATKGLNAGTTGKSKKEIKQERKALKREAKQDKKRNKKKAKGPIIKDITNQNKTRAMLGINIFFSIVIIALCVIFALQSKFNGSRARVNDVLYTAVFDASGNKSYQVAKYEGSKDAVIEDEVLGLKVTSIASKAFSGTTVETVTINASCAIEGGAFNNCPNLLTVTTSDDASCVFHALAFANCPKLESINASNSEVQVNAISGEIKTLTFLAFNTTNKASSLSRLFNGISDNSELPNTLVIECPVSNFNASFFDNFGGEVRNK